MPPWEKYATGGGPWSKYAPPPVMPQVEEEPGGVLTAVGDFVSGAAKEAPLVINRAANLPGDIVSGALSLLADKLGPDFQRADIQRNEAAYKLREGVEAPLRATADEGKASALGRIVSRGAPTAALAALTGGASLPAQAALMGATSGAQTVTEGGDGGDVALSAGIGAAAPMVAPLLSKAVGAPAKALRNLAVRQYERGLGATKEAMKTEAARITPELLERGVAGTLKGLSSKATGQVDDIGRQIQMAYKDATKAGVKVDGSKLADALESLKTPFREVGQGGQDVVLNPKAIGAIEDMQGILRELGDASPSSIWKFRKTVDDIVSASNGFTRELPGGTARSLQKQVRGILQEELNRAVPDVVKLNAEFRLWKGLQDVTAATIKRRTSQERNLIPAVLGGGVAGGTAATLGIPAGGATGLAVAGLVQMIRSPLWRTFSATQKYHLADILSGGSEALKTDAGKQILTTLALFSRGGVRPDPIREETGQ